MRVFVYWNLHKNVWSVKALEGKDKGRVIHHAQSVMLQNCTFKVSQAGRARVLREQCKNVHAGVVGTLVRYDSEDDVYMPHAVPVTYNPYKYETFVQRDNPTEPVQGAWWVHMAQSRRVDAIL
jgi:hypothetical protein